MNEGDKAQLDYKQSPSLDPPQTKSIVNSAVNVTIREL